MGDGEEGTNQSSDEPIVPEAELYPGEGETPPPEGNVEPPKEADGEPGEGDTPPEEEPEELPEEVIRALKDFDFGDVDVNELTVEVTVDGDTTPKKLGEVLKSYQISSAAEKRLREASAAKAEAKNFVEHKQREFELTNMVGKALGDIAAETKYLDRLQAEIDKSDLRTKDPAMYGVRVAEIDRARNGLKEQQAQIEQAAQGEFQKLQETSQAEHAKILQEQHTKLVEALPALSDPKEFTQWSDKISDFAKKVYGFEDSDIRNVVDHRVLLVLEDARLRHEGKQKVTAQKKKRSAAPKTMKPGAKTEPKPTPKSQVDILYG